MLALLMAATIIALASPALGQQAVDNPTWIPGQTSSSIVVYDAPGLSGSSIRVTERTGNLSGAFSARSLRTSGGAWQICDGANFRGECRVAEGWTMNLRDLGLSRVRSLRPMGTEAPRG